MEYAHIMNQLHKAVHHKPCDTLIVKTNRSSGKVVTGDNKMSPTEFVCLILLYIGLFLSQTVVEQGAGGR